MDNLTHSLTGALLGRMGLKRATGRAMATLIVASNLPDIDSFVARAFGAEPIAVHRGFTHGIGGWLTMPFVTLGLILLWGRFRPSKEPVRPWAVLLLAAIGTLVHSLLDLFTTYGTRIFEPLWHHWFYTGTWFIIDPWVWILLIIGLEASWRAERVGRDWKSPAKAVCAILLAYAGVNLALSARAETLTRRQLAAAGIRPTMVVAAPLPITTWKRRVLWRTEAISGSALYRPLQPRRLLFDRKVIPLNLALLPPEPARSRHLRAFLFWSWMPMVVQDDGQLYATDQRFVERTRRPRTNPFMVPLD